MKSRIFVPDIIFPVFLHEWNTSFNGSFRFFIFFFQGIVFWKGASFFSRGIVLQLGGGSFLSRGHSIGNIWWGVGSKKNDGMRPPPILLLDRENPAKMHNYLKVMHNT